jgi:hypothetical protein
MARVVVVCEVEPVCVQPVCIFGPTIVQAAAEGKHNQKPGAGADATFLARNCWNCDAVLM